MKCDWSQRVGRWLLAAAAVCLGAVVLRDLGVQSPLAPGLWDEAYDASQLLAVAACGLRAARLRGGERAAWGVLTLGLLGAASGDIYFSAASPTGTPSLSDVGYLSFYPAAYVALVLLLRARGGRVSAAVWLDGGVCGLAVAAACAALAFGTVAQTDGPLATVATNLAYPLGDLILLGFVVVAMVITGWRGGATWRLLALAFGLWAVADTIYLYQSAVGSYREFTPLDSAWPAAYLLMGLAGWRPAPRLDAGRLRGATLALPAGATLLALALLAGDHYWRLNDLALWLACGSVAMALARFALTFRENRRTLDSSEAAAATDVLTGLGNRRALLADLEHALRLERPATLALFDLDGFKSYNDRFGHVAGDVLLARLGANLAAAVGTSASAYRMGGDEFCVLVREPEEGPAAFTARAAVALSESGERFTITCSYGTVALPGEADAAGDALRIADQRMYVHKRGGRSGSDEAVHQVLLRVAAEHDGNLRDHVDDVALLADAVGRELGLDDAALTDLRRAAALHDIGKIAIPDAILHAPRALDAREWEYMRQHTVIGERIIAAAPALRGVAQIVRASHERFDGNGYPDRIAGAEIPLGARIVSVCDAYSAMVTTRAYRLALPAEDALAELRRCAGGQFDPAVVAAFETVIARAPLGAAPDQLASRR